MNSAGLAPLPSSVFTERLGLPFFPDNDNVDVYWYVHVYVHVVLYSYVHVCGRYAT